MDLEIQMSRIRDVLGPGKDSEEAAEEDVKTEHIQVDVHLPDLDSSLSDDEDDEEDLLPFSKRIKLDAWLPNTSGHKSPLIYEESSSSRPRASGAALKAESPLEYWEAFISNEILELLVKHTNSAIASEKSPKLQPHVVGDTDVVEMKALIGLVMLAGIYHASRLHLGDLWKGDGTGIELFRLTMPLARFRFLLGFLRFSDSEPTTDILSPVRQVFDTFTRNCQSNYTPSDFLTIDDMLLAFRGSCPFKQYVSTHPARYGIKVHTLCDVKTLYVYNMEIYPEEGPLPKDDDGSPQAVVKRLVCELSGSCRNITFDNDYTSVELIGSLYRDHKLTSIGALRKSSDEVVWSDNRRDLEIIHGFRENISLISYAPQSTKHKSNNILLLSSLHRDIPPESSSSDGLPEVVSFYNATRNGVTLLQNMMNKYSVARNSRSWPLNVFFALLNVASVNSYIVYVQNSPGNRLKRREFIKKITLCLVEDHLKRRFHNPSLPRRLRTDIGRLCNESLEIKVEGNNVAEPCKPKRCSFCTRTKDRKVKTKCSYCQKPVCKEHSRATLACVYCDDGASTNPS